VLTTGLGDSRFTLVSKEGRMQTWSRPAASTLGLAAALLLVAFVAASAAPGQSTPPPCSAGAVARPVVGAADYLAAEGDTRLFSTHPITIGIGFADDGPGIEPGSEAFALPPGATRVSDDLASNGAVPSQGIGESATVVEVLEQTGPLPVTVSWVQSDGTQQGRCSGATSATFALLGAVPARLTRPKSTGGLPDESTVRLKLPRTGGDLLPLEIRYRAVKGQHFPRAGVRARTVTVPLVSGGSGHQSPHTVTVRTGGLRLTMEPQVDDLVTPVLFTFEARPKGGRGTRFLRVAGQCHRIGGFVACSRKRVSLR
jgi:hypothetical protein